jgi:hypothetical protein
MTLIRTDDTDEESEGEENHREERITRMNADFGATKENKKRPKYRFTNNPEKSG